MEAASDQLRTIRFATFIHEKVGYFVMFCYFMYFSWQNDDRKLVNVKLRTFYVRGICQKLVLAISRYLFTVSGDSTLRLAKYC